MNCKNDEPVSPVPYGTVLSERFRNKNNVKEPSPICTTGAGALTTEPSNTSTNFYDRNKDPQTPKPMKSQRSKDDLVGGNLSPSKAN